MLKPSRAALVCAATAWTLMLSGPSWAQTPDVIPPDDWRLPTNPPRNPSLEPGFDIVKQAFQKTDPRYLLSFTQACDVGGGNPASRKGVAAPPSKLFDNFYYVGRTDVGAWVLKTSDGLILFDTLYNVGEVESIILPGMRKLGLDPAQIKYVIVSHAHRDHAGGMPYFRSKGTLILMGGQDWIAIGGAPNEQSIIKDGQILKLGDTSVKLILIPGHTPGTIASIFPVTENGKRHVVMLEGGMGSVPHMKDEIRKNGVDVFLNPHLAFSDSVAWGYVTRPEMRHPGHNDLVVGAPAIERFFEMQEICGRARAEMKAAGAKGAGKTDE